MIVVCDWENYSNSNVLHEGYWKVPTDLEAFGVKNNAIKPYKLERLVLLSWK